ncbi:MAG: type II toxin-antitoxin system death-on-curing family toxin [Gemmatimonadaceae bacterium]|nr:type II toxin-antitoxin system death-on-curing family toxin [Acetobacteraceae bacterium]
MTEPEFLELDVVIFMHDDAIRTKGGLPGLRDAVMLESALARPQNRFGYAGPGEVDLLDIAAAYAYGLVKNRAFHDGNKRVAWASAISFLAENEIEIAIEAQEAIETVIRLATDAVSEEAFAQWLRTKVVAPLRPAPP